MVVVGQDLRNTLATHRCHGDAVHKTEVFVLAPLIQMQTRQKGLTRLWMNCDALIVEDLADCVSGCLPQMRTALSQAVQKFGQHLVGRNQVGFPKRPPSADYLRPILVVWMKCCTPVERIREDQPHFFFGEPWR